MNRKILVFMLLLIKSIAMLPTLPMSCIAAITMGLFMAGSPTFTAFIGSPAQRPNKRVGRGKVKNWTEIHCSRGLSASESGISDDHLTAIAGWKSRKEQLHKQQESVMQANDEAEKKLNLVSLSKKKA